MNDILDILDTGSLVKMKDQNEIGIIVNIKDALEEKGLPAIWVLWPDSGLMYTFIVDIEVI